MARLTPRSLPHLPLPWECLRGLSESWPAGITHQTRRTTSGRCSGLARPSCSWLALSLLVRVRGQLVVEVGVEGGQQDANFAGSARRPGLQHLADDAASVRPSGGQFALAVPGEPQSACVSILGVGRSQSCRQMQRCQRSPRGHVARAVLRQVSGPPLKFDRRGHEVRRAQGRR